MGKSGGGQSGKVDYPEYIADIHGLVLMGEVGGTDNYSTGPTDTPTSSIVDLVNTAISTGNPFTGSTAYDPADELAATQTELALFSNYVTSVNPTNWADYAAVVKAYVDNNLINSEVGPEVEAYRDQVRDNLDGVVLPRFRGGMRDINAVMSSSFAIGEAYIEAASERDVSKFMADLQLKLKAVRDEIVTKVAGEMLQHEINKGELKKGVAHYTAETNRVAIVANKEENDFQLSIDEWDAKWDLEATMYVGNMIAAIAGASMSREGIAGPSAARSAIGGAMSGAAAGFMVGGPVGAGVGAVAGLALGLLG